MTKRIYRSHCVMLTFVTPGSALQTSAGKLITLDTIFQIPYCHKYKHERLKKSRICQYMPCDHSMVCCRTLRICDCCVVSVQVLKLAPCGASGKVIGKVQQVFSENGLVDIVHRLLSRFHHKLVDQRERAVGWCPLCVTVAAPHPRIL